MTAAKEPVVVEIANQSVLAGMTWLEIQPSKRGINSEARKVIQANGKNNTFTLISQAGDQGVYTVIPNDAGKNPTIGAAWFAKAFSKVDHLVVFFHPLERDHWWMVGVHNGLVIPGMDVVGRWDDCMTVYEDMRLLGLEQHVIAPPDTHGHFEDASYMSAAEALKGIERPVIKKVESSPLLLGGLGTVVLALVAGGGYWYYMEYIYEPPPPPAPIPTGPSSDDITVHNEQAKQKALTEAMEKVAATPSPVKQVGNCLATINDIGWRPPAWKISGIDCTKGVTMKFSKDRYARTKDLASWLGVNPGEKGSGFSAMAGDTRASYTLSMENTNRPADSKPKPLNWYIEEILPALEELDDAMNGDMRLRMNKAKPVQVSYTGWNEKGKDVPMTVKAYQEGNMTINGTNLERLRYAAMLMDYPSIRIKKITINPGKDIRWTMETQYVVKNP